MYIPIVLFIAIFFAILVALALTLKYLGFFNAPSKKEVIDPVISLGSQSIDFTIPSMWQHKSTDYPLDPVQPGPGCVIYPDNAVIPPESQICYLYSFKTKDFYPPKFKFDASYLETCESTGFCQKKENDQLCLYLDQAYLMKGAKECNNPAQAESNAGKGCISNTGQFAPNGTTECSYTQCYFPGTTSPLPPCPGELNFVNLNYLTGYINPDPKYNLNPVSNLLCLQYNYLSNGQSSVTLEECNIQKSIFDSSGNCLAGDCETQIFQIIRFAYTSLGDLTESPNGPFIAIRDRNTKLFLAPVGFNPNSPSTLPLNPIPAGGYQETYPVIPQFVYDVTFSVDADSPLKGAYWYLTPEENSINCLDVANVLCRGPQQLIFIGNYIQNLARNNNVLPSSPQLWYTSYSLAFWPNYNTIPVSNNNPIPRNPKTITPVWHGNDTVTLKLIPYVIETFNNTAFTSPTPCNETNCNNPAVDGSYNLNVGLLSLPAYNTIISSQKTS